MSRTLSSTPEQHPWVYALAAKLLVNDPDVTSIMARNPFQGGPPPDQVFLLNIFRGDEVA
jgi:hypothetical protein